MRVWRTVRAGGIRKQHNEPMATAHKTEAVNGYGGLKVRTAIRAGDGDVGYVQVRTQTSSFCSKG